MKSMISAIDLFCGAGGLTCGLKKAGIDVIAGIDIDPYSRYPYEMNNKIPFIQKDIRTVTSNEVAVLFHSSNNPFRLLAGCAPCQPFSGYSNGRDVTKDLKWPLLREFSRLIRDLRPEFVTMENVPQVTKHSIYDEFVNSLEALGYHVSASTVFCPEYGIPQARKRHVLIASTLFHVPLINPTHSKDRYLTVRDAIGMIEPLTAGAQSSKDPLHVTSNLSSINLKRIKASIPGGTWRDWPTELIAKCHTKASGKSYPSVYGRMSWNEPAPTITTQCYGFGNGRFGHPEQDRAISLREAAIFQTFPKSYKFFDRTKKLKMGTVGTLIGNAVPPKLGKVIGESILNSIK